MKTFLIASFLNVTSQVVNDSVLSPEEIATLFESFPHQELLGGQSELALRYKFENSSFVDQYPGMSDVQVMAAVKLAGEEANALTQTEIKTKFEIAPTDFLRFLGAVRRINIRGLVVAGEPVATDFMDMFDRVSATPGSKMNSQDSDLKQALQYLQALPDAAFGVGATNPFASVYDDFYELGYTFA